MKKKLSIILTLALVLTSFSAVIDTNTVYAASPNIKQIDGGISFSLALRDDGTVWAWGNNSIGSLGDGTIIDKYVPIKISNLCDIIAISSSGASSYALKSDGTVWSWGRNNYYQLGDGTSKDKKEPVQVSNLDNVIAISTSGTHVIALKEDGTAWCWGQNDKGQLGDDTTTLKKIPVQVLNLDNVIAISTGSVHSLALKDDGTVWSWGNNPQGQLGDGTNKEKHIPVQVLNLDNIIAVSSGLHYSLALKNDGTVWAWGRNNGGQLGNGITTNTNKPFQIANLDNVIAVSAFNCCSFALKKDGTLWAWGSNYSGQLGDSTYIDKHTPTQVMNNVKSVYGCYNHMFAVKNDGTIWAWGNNTSGQLGDGTAGTYNKSNIPIQVFSCPFSSSSNASLNLTAVGGDSKVTLNWNEVSDYDGYKVYRSTTSGEPYDLIESNVTTSSYIDLDVTNGTTYYYVVTAVNSDGESDYSNEASATPHADEQPTGDRALLVITMQNGLEKEYDMSMTEVEEFMEWCNSDNAEPYYTINKDYNVGPFTSRKDYIAHDKIMCFEVNEY